MGTSCQCANARARISCFHVREPQSRDKSYPQCKKARQTQSVVIAHDTTQRRRMAASRGTTRLLPWASAVVSVLDQQRLERAPLDDGKTVGFPCVRNGSGSAAWH